MNRRFDSEHESGSTRTAFEALRASRPRTPAELTSVDTDDAAAMFWRIVGDVESQPRRHRFRRRHFTLAVTAAAAAAVIGVLVALPDRDTPVSVGESATTMPTGTEPAPTPVATEVGDATALWPAIAPSPPVGAALTARANMVVNDQFQQSTNGPEVITMADGDVNIALPIGQGEDGAMQYVDNRYAGGEWYYHFLDDDGEGMAPWQYDPNDTNMFVGVSPSDPRELYDRLAPSAGFEADGSDFVLGVETVHLVATTPEAIDPALAAFSGADLEAVESLELWIDSNGIVRRIDVTYVMPPVMMMGADGGTVPAEELGTSATVSIEFYDIGEPITVDVPRDAVEVDAQG